VLKKKFRLPPGRFKAQDSFVSPLYVLKTAANNFSGPRFAVVVSKRVNKSAVERNKIKRMIRLCIQENLKENEKKDYLFLVKKELKDFQSLCEDMKKHL
jgi:ribonuclease P protein component